MGTFLCEALKVFFAATALALQPCGGKAFPLSFHSFFFFFLNELEIVWEALPFMRREDLGRQDYCFQEVTDDCAILSDPKARAWVLHKIRSYPTCLRTIPACGLYGLRQKTQLLSQLLTSVALISCKKDAPRPAKCDRAPKLVKSHSPTHQSSSSLRHLLLATFLRSGRSIRMTPGC